MEVSLAPFPGNTSTVVIADERPIFRRGLRNLVEGYGLIAAAEAATAGELLREIQAHVPELVIVNTEMLSAKQVTDLGRLLSPDTAWSGTLLLALYENPARARQMLAAGSRACLHCTAAPEELKGAVSAVVSGGYYLDNRLGINALRRGGPETGHRLTPTESNVLSLIAEGLTNRQIAERLHFSVRTVESQRSGLRKKLGLRDRSQLTRFARERELSAS